MHILRFPAAVAVAELLLMINVGYSFPFGNTGTVWSTDPENSRTPVPAKSALPPEKVRPAFKTNFPLTSSSPVIVISSVTVYVEPLGIFRL